MRALTWQEIAAIAEADRERRGEPRPGGTLAQVFGLKTGERRAEIGYRLQNRTRFYKWLVVEGNDVEVRTVAVITRRDGMTRCVKEVVRASVDGKSFWVKDLAWSGMGGYMVDWSPEKAGRRRDWSYHGKWEIETWRRGCKWQLDCDTLNLEELAGTERFRYCAYTRECGDVLAYLRAYGEHPKLELLSKAGAGEFCRRLGFVARLEKDKGLLRFFSNHLPEIKKGGYGCNVIGMAYRRGISFSEADHRLECGRRAGKLPKPLEAVKVCRYVEGQRGASMWDYKNYLRLVAERGLDLNDTKVAYPKDFHARLAELEAWRDERRRREDSATRREFAGKLRAAAAAFAAIAGRRGSFAAVVPRSEAEFRKEGKALHHCVGGGGYAQKMADGKTLLVFVRRARRPGEPYVTAEIDPAAGKVLQCYGLKNSKPDGKVLDFVGGELAKAARRCWMKAQKAQKKKAG